MQVTLLHHNLKIEVFDDSSFFDGVDSPTQYDKVYQPEEDKAYKPSSQHAINVYKDEEKVACAILLGATGATYASEDAVFCREAQLIIRCGNNVYGLSLPELELNWKTETDWATCFSIHPYENDFITFGETSVKRIDMNGNIIWDFGGVDIFVTLDGSIPFIMHDDHIALRDYIGMSYSIDYDGKTLSKDSPGPLQTQPDNSFLVPKKSRPWWKFWHEVK